MWVQCTQGQFCRISSDPLHLGNSSATSKIRVNFLYLFPDTISSTYQAGVTGAETTAHWSRARLPEDPLPGFGRKTLAEACTELGLEPAAIATSLKALGIAAEPGMTMKEIADDCGRAPREIYEIIRTIAERE